MSAERTIFRLIDNLLKEQEIFQDHFVTTGKILIRQAAHEFMIEHPEVTFLSWYQQLDDNQERMTSLADFTVEIAGIRYHWQWIQDEKLSKCLQALEDKFRALKEILPQVFGKTTVVVITQDTVKAAVG